MTEWTVIELQNWKHGWIPLTPEAAAIKAKKKSGSLKGKPGGTSGKLTVADALANNKLPPALRTNPPYKGQTEQQWHAEINEYLKKYPEGWKEPSAAPAKPTASKVKPKVAAKKVKKADADSSAHLSPAQKATWDQLRGTEADDADPNPQHKLLAEWQSVDKAPELDPDEQEALEVWQNGVDESTGVDIYKIMNEALRSGKKDALAKSVMDYDMDVNLEELDYAMRQRLAKSKASRDLTLFRGIQHADQLGVGDTLTDPGWAATSYNPTVADSFRQSTSGKLLIVHAPKGTPLLRVPDPMEHEVLFGPDTPMRVTRVDGDEIHVRVEPRR